MNTARLSAMLVKEYHDIKSNFTILSVLFVPLFLAVIFSRLDGEQDFALSFIFLEAVAFVTMYAQAVLIGEEKEKNTLQVLLLSPATAAEIMIGKSIISVILTVITFVVPILIIDVRMESPLLFCIILLLAVIFFAAMGTLVGLLSENLVQTSMYILPLSFLFGFSPMIEMYFSDSVIADILGYSPGNYIMEACMGAINGEAFSSYRGDILWLGGWTIAALAVTLLTFKKKKLSK
ncbi:ABC transporter permease [Terribacillus sp. FSL K6-0262]|uniref:ABC transporter permease n=1 Tax=Terribacillus sp. FSL K6-0262 TaxID=2921447 RepID=UPI0030EE2577